MRSSVAAVIGNVQRKGARRTFVLVLSRLLDSAFDLRHRTQTWGWVDLGGLGIGAEAGRHAMPYRPTTSFAFSELMRRLALPRDTVFVDFGCGKGRVVLMAQEYDFQRIVGVELSADLCRIARENVAACSVSSPRPAAAEIVEGDAAGYTFRDDETCLYLFDPFDAHVLRKVMENAKASLARRQRRMHLIYQTPVHRAVVEQAGCFALLAEHLLFGNEYAIFVST